jgi:ClpX C4-type zinc finger protein
MAGLDGKMIPPFSTRPEAVRKYQRARIASPMETAKCSFCNRSEDQVTHLVQGPDLFICDICVDACIDTLAVKDHGWRERQIDYLMRLRHR